MAPETERALAAGAVLLCYAAFCLVFAWRAHRRRRPLHASAEGDPVLVAFASQTGSAEELAERAAASLRRGSVAVRVAGLDALDAGTLAAARRAVFVVSTTGEGDAPDNAARFVRQVMQARVPLAGLDYGLLALGDRSYRHYCDFGRRLDSWLQAQGARPLFDRIEVDGGAGEALQRWHRHVGDLAGIAPAPDVLAGEPFSPWRLVERTVLNPGGLGAPVFRLAFVPVGDMPRWNAGDIAVVVPGSEGADPRRDYSVASLPRDGKLELLVRQVRHADGSLGLGSGFLTARLDVGAEAMLRVRPNRAFHAPDDDRPLVLVGNGTGIAGLRAHLRARAAAGRQRNWLLFGERGRAADFLCGAEIEAWRASGLLARLDLAFSREEPRRYVQDALRAAAGDLRAWIDEGAAIMVCGSLQGMAPGVHAALQDSLGAARLDALAAEGRYRRDVY